MFGYREAKFELKDPELGLIRLVEAGNLTELKKVALNTSQKKILLFAAAKYGNCDVIEYLLPDPVDEALLNEQHAFAKSQYGVYDFANKCIREIVGKNFIGHYETANALMAAILYDQSDAAKLLIKKGINLKSPSGSPRGAIAIHLAAIYGRSEIVQALLDADKSLVNEYQNFPMTPLMEAAYNGKLETIKVLVANGAAFGEGDYNVFLSAQQGGNADVMHYLIIETDALKHNSKEQFKAGLYAINIGDKDLLETILDKFPDLITRKDESGKTLLHHVGTYLQYDARPEKKVATFEIEKLLLRKNDAISQADDNRHHRPSFYAPRGKHRDLLKLCDIREKYIARKTRDYGEIKFLGITFRYASKDKRSAAKHLIEATLEENQNKLSDRDKNILKHSPEFRTIYRHLSR